jgi:hypothetical protein
VGSAGEWAERTQHEGLWRNRLPAAAQLDSAIAECRARSTALRHIAELEGHVAESTSLVARQERIVTNLERIGQDAARASRILEALRAMQVSEKRQLEEIRSSLAD